MGDEDRSRELPSRVPGSARDGSDRQAGRPVLSEELRQRIQAAVKAERAQAAAKDEQTSTEPSKQTISSGSADGDVPGPTVNGLAGQRRHAAKPSHAARPDRGARGHAATLDHAAKPERAAKPESRLKPERRAAPERTARSHTATKAEAAQPEGAVTARTTARAQPAIDVPARRETAHRETAHREPAAPWLVETPAQDPANPPEQPGESAPQERRWAGVRMIAMILVLIGVGSLVTAVSLHIVNRSDGNSAAQAALQRQEVVTSRQAASWVAQQVDRDVLVSCDQAMCAALRNAGFPAGQLLVLRETSPLPVTSAVVVVTAAVREIFGSSLESAWAPEVLASFGSGTAQVTIRLMAPNGSGAYLAALSAGLQGPQGRKAYGAVLGETSQIKLSSVAAQQLDAGQVDERLVLAIATLAGYQPVKVMEFGNIGPGASASLPLRFADLAENDPAANLTGPAYVQALRAESVQFRPVSSQTVTLPGGQHVFRIEFSAPSPFGQIANQGP